MRWHTDSQHAVVPHFSTERTQWLNDWEGTPSLECTLMKLN